MKTSFQTLDALERAMTFHRHRHAVLSGNLANVDTPGFRSLDLRRQGPGPTPQALVKTHAVHGDALGATPSVDEFFDDGTAPGIDGNTVSLERELAKVDANRVRYTTAASLVSRRTALLRYAASDGVG